MNQQRLSEITVSKLREMAAEYGIKGYSKMKKEDLVACLSEKSGSVGTGMGLSTTAQLPKTGQPTEVLGVQAEVDLDTNATVSTPARRTSEKVDSGETHRSGKRMKDIANAATLIDAKYAKVKEDMQAAAWFEGTLTVLPEGFGIAQWEENDATVYISPSQIQKFRLVTGDVIGGKVRNPKPGEKYAALVFLEKVNDVSTVEILKQMNRMMRNESTEGNDRYQTTQNGILDIGEDGSGFLRQAYYRPTNRDIYVAANQVRRYRLRTGDFIEGRLRKPGEGERYDSLLYVERVNGDLPETVVHRPKFERLVPVFPTKQIMLETDPDILSTRMIDLFAPVGKGQRGMIVAPPKAGKTTLLKNIARGIRLNHPEIHLIILLVDERPEEVTDMRRTVDAEIVDSTFDKPSSSHISASEMVLARGKRLLEQGRDVVILVDSLTRMTRANNQIVEPSGRTLSGGLDPEALFFPKKFFGAARAIENGGSLTILATALIETGSRMDDIVYEEFKGTGNMELHLSRELAERRIFPAMDIRKSGTRREELLLTPEALKVSYLIHRLDTNGGSAALTSKIIDAMEKTDANAELVRAVVKKNKL